VKIEWRFFVSNVTDIEPDLLELFESLQGSR